MPVDYIPPQESRLNAWARNLSEWINADPAGFGVPALTAAQFQTTQQSFAALYEQITSPTARTPAAIIAKNGVKKTLIAQARQIAGLIQASPVVTDDQRGKVGLTIRKRRMTQVRRPHVAPVLAVLAMEGRSVRCRLRDMERPDSRGRAPGIIGAVLLRAVGEQAPMKLSGWTFVKIASRGLFTVHLPGDIPLGAKVWLTAMWVNRRGQTGPAAAPRGVRAAEGLAKAA